MRKTREMMDATHKRNSTDDWREPEEDLETETDFDDAEPNPYPED